MLAHYDLCDYTKFWEGREYEDKAEKLAIGKFLPQIKNKESFIDVGGGYGRLTEYIAKYFKRGTLVDPSERNLQTAKIFLKNTTNVSLVKGSLPNLDFKDNSFDLVNTVRVSHHLVNIEPAIKELVRIIKPGGYLIIEVANKINLVARLKAYLKGDWWFVHDLEIKDRSSEESRRLKKIAFVNHHPQDVLNKMKSNGLTIMNILSVSNLRSGTLKKMFPVYWLLKFETLLQSPLAHIQVGPSIFILARKEDILRGA